MPVIIFKTFMQRHVCPLRPCVTWYLHCCAIIHYFRACMAQKVNWPHVTSSCLPAYPHGTAAFILLSATPHLALIKKRKENKLSSYIRKSRWERLQSLRPQAESYNINSEHWKDTFSAEISSFRVEKSTFWAEKPTIRIRALKPACLNLKTHPIFSVLTVVSRDKDTCLQCFHMWESTKLDKYSSHF